MAIDPVKIPQDIHVEDKIVGPITFRQLILILIGGSISYFIWTQLRAQLGGHVPVDKSIMAWTPLMIAAAFAFVKVNNVFSASFLTNG